MITKSLLAMADEWASHLPESPAHRAASSSHDALSLRCRIACTPAASATYACLVSVSDARQWPQTLKFARAETSPETAPVSPQPRILDGLRPRWFILLKLAASLRSRSGAGSFARNPPPKL